MAEEPKKDSKKIKFFLDGEIESRKDSVYLKDKKKGRERKVRRVLVLFIFLTIGSLAFLIFKQYQVSSLHAQNQVLGNKLNAQPAYKDSVNLLHLLVDSLLETNSLMQNANALLIENSKAPKGIFFEILIDGFDDFDIKAYSEELAKLRVEDQNGYFGISIARFRNFKTALLFENDLKKIGYKNTLLLGRVDGKLVRYKDALRLKQKLDL